MSRKRSNGEGTLRRRPNGLWECSMMVGYKDDGTRRYKSFYGKSQKEARGKAETYKQEVAAGLYISGVGAEVVRRVQGFRFPHHLRKLRLHPENPARGLWAAQAGQHQGSGCGKFLKGPPS